MLDNPLRIDRGLREVARVRATYRQRLRRGVPVDHAFEHVGARVSAELLEELRSNGGDDPLGPALLRWAHLLQEEHALVELDRQWAEAWHVEQHALEQPLSGTRTLAELRMRALAERRGGRALYWNAWFARCGRAGELALRRWERRAEHAAELRVDRSRWERLPEGIDEDALGLLTATDEPFAALGVRDPSDLVALALGEDSGADWPAHLGVRSLVALFDEPAWFKHVTFDLADLPQPLGASSFLRGLDELGRELRRTLVSSRLPFVAAHDPFELEAATWGALFALLPFGESFAARRLGVARARLSDHRRALSRVLVISLREAALRALLRAPALEGALRRSYQELGERAFRMELPAPSAGALFCPRYDSAQRFAALGLAAELDGRLIETHDEDWYRNPRAVTELRENAAAAPVVEVDRERMQSGLTLLARRLAH